MRDSTSHSFNPTSRLLARSFATDFWFYVVAFVIVVLAFLIVYANAGEIYSTDAFVRMIEQHEGVYPGQVRVLPECNCSIKYLGTERRGNVYNVVLEKMD